MYDKTQVRVYEMPHCNAIIGMQHIKKLMNVIFESFFRVDM